MAPAHPNQKLKKRSTWLPTAAQHYFLHKEKGTPIRTIAREIGCHASTVSRQVKRIERLRNEPAVKATLDKLKQAQNGLDSYMADAVDPEEKRILKLMHTEGAVLVLAENMQKAIIVMETPTHTAQTIGTVLAEVAQSMAMRGVLQCISSGKLSRFVLTSQGKTVSASSTPVPAITGNDEPDGLHQKLRLNPKNKGQRETPLAILARRRDKSGEAFLSRALVAAGQRLQEDFEIAKLRISDEYNWDRFLIETAQEAAKFYDARQRDAIERVAGALRELGPGLGDIALQCCCYLEGLETTEKTLGWSARSGKIVLRIALQRLKRHYDRTFGPGGGQIH